MELQTDINLFNQPPAKPSFHNTVEAKDKELAIYEGKACSQEKIVLQFFEQRPGQKFTSEAVWKVLLACKLIHDRVPKDSIKRCISNLKRKGKLTKILDELTTGEYGKPLHYYELTV